MKKLIAFLLATFAITPSLASNCMGSDTLYTCYDDNGNTYNVNKMGNYTYVDGYNARTGSRWKSDSTTLGNYTYQNGTDANGNRWNQTIQHTSFGTVYSGTSGTDSNGKSYTKTCNSYGCY